MCIRDSDYADRLSKSENEKLRVEESLVAAQKLEDWSRMSAAVSHEIKNPLTPIALSAERIARHLDRGITDSPQVIRKCSEVILGCVGTLRTCLLYTSRCV